VVPLRASVALNEETMSVVGLRRNNGASPDLFRALIYFVPRAERCANWGMVFARAITSPSAAAGPECSHGCRGVRRVLMKEVRVGAACCARSCDPRWSVSAALPAKLPALGPFAVAKISCLALR
jgi:hypothetical protein